MGRPFFFCVDTLSPRLTPPPKMKTLYLSVFLVVATLTCGAMCTLAPENTVAVYSPFLGSASAEVEPFATFTVIGQFLLRHGDDSPFTSPAPTIEVFTDIGAGVAEVDFDLEVEYAGDGAYDVRMYSTIVRDFVVSARVNGTDAVQTLDFSVISGSTLVSDSVSFATAGSPVITPLGGYSVVLSGLTDSFGNVWCARGNPGAAGPILSDSSVLTCDPLLSLDFASATQSECGTLQVAASLVSSANGFFGGATEATCTWADTSSSLSFVLEGGAIDPSSASVSGSALGWEPSVLLSSSGELLISFTDAYGNPPSSSSAASLPLVASISGPSESPVSVVWDDELSAFRVSARAGPAKGLYTLVCTYAGSEVSSITYNVEPVPAVSGGVPELSVFSSSASAKGEVLAGTPVTISASLVSSGEATGYSPFMDILYVNGEALSSSTVTVNGIEATVSCADLGNDLCFTHPALGTEECVSGSEMEAKATNTSVVCSYIFPIAGVEVGAAALDVVITANVEESYYGEFDYALASGFRYGNTPTLAGVPVWTGYGPGVGISEGIVFVEYLVEVSFGTSAMLTGVCKPNDVTARLSLAPLATVTSVDVTLDSNPVGLFDIPSASFTLTPGAPSDSATFISTLPVLSAVSAPWTFEITSVSGATTPVVSAGVEDLDLTLIPFKASLSPSHADPLTAGSAVTWNAALEVSEYIAFSTVDVEVTLPDGTTATSPLTSSLGAPAPCGTSTFAVSSTILEAYASSYPVLQGDVFAALAEWDMVHATDGSSIGSGPADAAAEASVRLPTGQVSLSLVSPPPENMYSIGEVATFELDYAVHSADIATLDLELAIHTPLFALGREGCGG